jgi:hypothetical protein
MVAINESNKINKIGVFTLFFSVMAPLLLTGCGIQPTASTHKITPVVVPQQPPAPQWPNQHREEQKKERKKEEPKKIEREVPNTAAPETTEQTETIKKSAEQLVEQFIKHLQTRIRENKSESVKHHIYILGGHEQDDDPVASCVIAKALVPTVEASYNRMKNNLDESARQGLGDILIDPATLGKYLERSSNLNQSGSGYQPMPTPELATEKVRFKFRAIASSDRKLYEVIFDAFDLSGQKIDIRPMRIRANSFFSSYRDICTGMLAPSSITEVKVMTPHWEGSEMRYSDSLRSGESYIGNYLLQLKIDRYDQTNSRLVGLVGMNNSVQRLLPLYPQDRKKKGCQCQQIPDHILQKALQGALADSGKLLYPDQGCPLTTYGDEKLYFYLITGVSSEQLSQLDHEVASMPPSLCSPVPTDTKNYNVKSFEHFLKERNFKVVEKEVYPL